MSFLAVKMCFMFIHLFINSPRSCWITCFCVNELKLQSGVCGEMIRLLRLHATLITTSNKQINSHLRCEFSILRAVERFRESDQLKQQLVFISSASEVMNQRRLDSLWAPCRRPTCYVTGLVGLFVGSRSFRRFSDVTGRLQKNQPLYALITQRKMNQKTRTGSEY